MAKDKKDKEKAKKERDSHLDYPMRIVFQVSLLAACVSFILLYLNNVANLSTILFRSFIVFVAFAIGGGTIVIIIFTIMAHNRQRELKEAEDKLFEEQKAADLKATELREEAGGSMDFGAALGHSSDQNNTFSL